MTDNIIQFADPNSDPVQDKLLQAHEEEAARLGVEFTNFGWGTDEYGIVSKTTKGILDSSINPKTMQVSHGWITWEETDRREEQQKRKLVELLGESSRGHVWRQLKLIREVYADLTEFAPVWDAIDKIEDR